MPEKRSKAVRKSASNEGDQSAASGNNEPSSVDQAINYVLNDVFYSLKQPVEKMNGNSALDRALNYLFVDEEEN